MDGLMQIGSRDHHNMQHTSSRRSASSSLKTREASSSLKTSMRATWIGEEGRRPGVDLETCGRRCRRRQARRRRWMAAASSGQAAGGSATGGSARRRLLRREDGQLRDRRRRADGADGGTTVGRSDPRPADPALQKETGATTAVDEERKTGDRG